MLFAGELCKEKVAGSARNETPVKGAIGMIGKR
jgi:hypothetical protein